MSEFITPSFLQNHSPREVFAKMKAVLPADIDSSEGSHTWNYTYPTALVLAEVFEFILPEVIKVAIPEWSYGDLLDSHAKGRGMTRRAATAATGELTITGEAGTIIQSGNLFSTAAVNDEPSVDYKVLTSTKIPDTGTVTVKVQCTQTGIVGNAPANTVILVSSRITGIKSVTNPEAISGGTEEETDESLIERILDYDQSQGDSFVGSVADYKRWASSVAGVGSATVIPAQDTSGLVTIILTDSNGDPATEELCNEVYNYIMSPGNPDERRAPINAFLSVAPPSTMTIGIKATVELADDATIEAVKEAYLAKLAVYLPAALDDGEIKLTRVAAALASTEGAADFANLQIGLKTGGSVAYGTSNIPITSSQLPTIAAEDLILTAGSV